MPNRILREAMLDSENLSKAGELAEVLFVRMLLIVDDFGRFDGRLSVICRRCWPLGEPSDPSEVAVLERMSKLIENKLIIPYEVDGKPFIYIPKFKQRTRAEKSKFPEPPSTYPQNDGPVTDKGRAGAWHSTDGGPASASVVRSSPFDIRSSGEPVDKSKSKPRAQSPGITKTQQQLEAQRAMPPPNPIPDEIRNSLPPNLRHAMKREPPQHEDGHEPGESLDT